MLEGACVDRPDIETKGHRLAPMDEAALDAEIAPQDVAHAGGQHEQARRHVLLADDRYALAVRPGLQGADPAGDEAHALG